MELLSEMTHRGFGINKCKAEVHCKVFEDTSGAVEMARIHKFRSYVNSNRISIHAIESGKQLADYLMKPLNAETLPSPI